jgi:hypothetical protein
MRDASIVESDLRYKPLLLFLKILMFTPALYPVTCGLARLDSAHARGEKAISLWEQRVSRNGTGRL